VVLSSDLKTELVASEVAHEKSPPNTINLLQNHNNLRSHLGRACSISSTNYGYALNLYVRSESIAQRRITSHIRISTTNVINKNGECDNNGKFGITVFSRMLLAIQI